MVLATAMQILKWDFLKYRSKCDGRSLTLYVSRFEGFKDINVLRPSLELPARALKLEIRKDEMYSLAESFESFRGGCRGYQTLTIQPGLRAKKAVGGKFARGRTRGSDLETSRKVMNCENIQTGLWLTTDPTFTDARERLPPRSRPTASACPQLIKRSAHFPMFPLMICPETFRKTRQIDRLIYHLRCHRKGQDNAAFRPTSPGKETLKTK